MSIKQRGQNIRIGDTVRLKLFVYNGSAPANVASVEQVAIYRLYATEKTEDNPYGKLLVETITGNHIIQADDGQYYVEIELTNPKYTIDKYTDEWSLKFNNELPTGVSEQMFSIYPNAWFADARPVVYDFDITFSPNKIVQGSKKFIEIEVVPNVPNNSEKLRYYKNMIAAGELYISIKQVCVPCMPAEEDLQLIVDKEVISERDFCTGYYFLDTTEMDCGIYHVWFHLELGNSVYVTEKQPLQVFN